jgi:hypothetical protein
MYGKLTPNYLFCVFPSFLPFEKEGHVNMFIFLTCLLFHDLCVGDHDHDIHSVCALSHTHSQARIQVSSFNTRYRKIVDIVPAA